MKAAEFTHRAAILIGMWFAISMVSSLCSQGLTVLSLAMAVFGGLYLGIYTWAKVDLQMVPLPAHLSGKTGFGGGPRRAALLTPSLVILFLYDQVPIFLTLIAVLTLGVLFVMRISAPRNIFPELLFLLPSGLLLITAIFSLTVQSRLDSASVGALCGLSASVYVVFELITVVPTEEKVRKGLVALTTAGVGVSVSTFLVMELPYYKENALTVPFVSHYQNYLPELFQRTVNPNYLGGILALIVPIALGLCVCQARKSFMLGAATLVVCVGLLMSQSRSAIIGAVFSSVIVGSYCCGTVRRALPILLVLLGPMIYWRYLDMQQYPSAIAEPMRNLSERFDLWERSIGIARARPIFGIGLRSFPQALALSSVEVQLERDRIPHPHNNLLTVLVSVGYPGLVAYCAVFGSWIMAAHGCIRARLPPATTSRKVGVALAGGILAHSIYGILDAVALGEKAGLFVWVVIGLTFAQWRLVSRVRQ